MSLHGYNTAAAPPNTKWAFSDKGWMNDNMGEMWFRDLFLLECGAERPQLLIMDGHASHKTPGLLEMAQAENIHVLCLPPHCTHFLQPLDRTVFGHFKSYYDGVKVPSTSSLSVYTKVLAHNLNDIRNWASLIGLLLRICWCLLSVFLIYCSDEWKKLVNLIYCFQVLFRMNFKIMYFLMKILGNTPSADSAASRDSLSSQNAT